jgi:hypothetical protein
MKKTFIATILMLLILISGCEYYFHPNLLPTSSIVYKIETEDGEIFCYTKGKIDKDYFAYKFMEYKCDTTYQVGDTVYHNIKR